MSHSSNLYCTLDQVKHEIKSAIATDDHILFELIESVSRRVDTEVGDSLKAMFVPNKTMKRLPMQSWRILENGQTYDPHFPLQALEATNGVLINGTTDITAKCEVGSDYRLRWKYAEVGDFLQSVAYLYGVRTRLHITGTWCFHSDYASAWTAEDTLSAAVVSTTATTITVSSTTNPDAHGHSPKISPGNLLQIDSEWLYVTDTQNTTVTVVRGVNGTTAATHLIATPVYVYHFDPVLAHAVARQVGLLYARRGAYNTATFDGVGTTSFPEDEMGEIKAVVARYRMILDA